MKGNTKVIEKLNSLLADELTAISQYMVQAEMCPNWGYRHLSETIEKPAIDEMKHAEKHIERIIFLEEKPIVSELNKLHIGETVEAFHKNDWDAENGALQAYNDGIKLATEMSDNGTREMLESILRDEENHIDWIEAQFDQIKQMGIQVYLSEQIS
jgi:bacterioferritin